jgi:hypothetical protein
MSDSQKELVTEQEPHWATRKDAFGNPCGRYSWHGRQRGWSCHHCGGLFRGLPALLEHQERMIATECAVITPGTPS